MANDDSKPNVHELAAARVRRVLRDPAFQEAQQRFLDAMGSLSEFQRAPSLDEILECLEVLRDHHFGQLLGQGFGITVLVTSRDAVIAKITTLPSAGDAAAACDAALIALG